MKRTAKLLVLGILISISVCLMGSVSYGEVQVRPEQSTSAPLMPNSEVKLRDMPDLVVEKLYPSIGGSYSNLPDYCLLDNNNNLEIRITNQGKVNVSGSIDVWVKFIQDGTLKKLQTTGGVGPGGWAKVTTPIPAACYKPECLFTITVDPDNKIQESNEANNTVSGKCFACVKPKVQRIDFSIVSRTGPLTGRVRILGVMKNLGNVPCNLVHVYIYENNFLVKTFDNTQTSFGLLDPGQEMILGYERDWDASSRKWEFSLPPTYKVEITGESRIGGPCASASDSMERSGSDINKLFTQGDIKTVPKKQPIPHTIPLPR